jgi:hypothetical protein
LRAIPAAVPIAQGSPRIGDHTRLIISQARHDASPVRCGGSGRR